MGYTFHWAPWSKRPYFVQPGSEQRVHLQTMGCITCLVDKHNTEGLQKAPPVSALLVREPMLSSTALGAGPGTGSGPPAVEEVTAAGNGNAPGEEEEAEMPVSRREQLQAEAKSLGHLMSHRPFNPFCRTCVEGRTRKK